jgi:hypothetical protein
MKTKYILIFLFFNLLIVSLQSIQNKKYKEFLQGYDDKPVDNPLTSIKKADKNRPVTFV